MLKDTIPISISKDKLNLIKNKKSPMTYHLIRRVVKHNPEILSKKPKKITYFDIFLCYLKNYHSSFINELTPTDIRNFDIGWLFSAYMYEKYGTVRYTRFIRDDFLTSIKKQVRTWNEV